MRSETEAEHALLNWKNMHDNNQDLSTNGSLSTVESLSSSDSPDPRSDSGESECDRSRKRVRSGDEDQLADLQMKAWLRACDGCGSALHVRRTRCTCCGAPQLVKRAMATFCSEEGSHSHMVAASAESEAAAIGLASICQEQPARSAATGAPPPTSSEAQPGEARPAVAAPCRPRTLTPELRVKLMRLHKLRLLLSVPPLRPQNSVPSPAGMSILASVAFANS